MDTLSHTLIGIAVAGFSHHPLSFHDPIYIAAVLGAQAPDFDIVAQLRGGLSYLRQHRAFSHSIPGVFMWSSLIAVIIHAVMPSVSLVLLFAWALAGGVSHIVTDYYNTHGVALLWPVKKERYSTHLLNVFDPLLIFLMLSVYTLGMNGSKAAIATFIILSAYITARAVLRLYAKHSLIKKFSQYGIKRILIMPSLKSILYWDFILETPEHYLVGKISLFYEVTEIKANLPKNGFSDIIMQAKKTPLGRFFHAFSPFIYWEESKEIDSTKIKMYDLRYICKEEFVHTATLTFNNRNIPYESYILSEGKKIKFPFC